VPPAGTVVRVRMALTSTRAVVPRAGPLPTVTWITMSARVTPVRMVGCAAMGRTSSVAPVSPVGLEYIAKSMWTIVPTHRAAMAEPARIRSTASHAPAVLASLAPCVKKTLTSVDLHPV
jgi:hypothetical protein